MNEPAHLVDGKYGIGDLVDLADLRRMFDRFTEATGFTIGFLDHPGMNILIATGWRDLCTIFHRSCPASLANCQNSNQHLLNHLDEPGKLVIEECENGLVDCAYPIIIKGKHIASLATGQLLLETPDRERFRRQAKRFGLDEQAYMKALDEIPVVPEAKLRSVTMFLGEMALLLSEVGYARLTSREDAERLQQAQKMESVGRLAGGVAHDFNNMLGVILGHAELAMEQAELSQPIHDALEEIRKAANRSADLTRQLLAFARKQAITPKVLNLNETVSDMLGMLRRLIGENIRLDWHPAEDPWLVHADPSQIDQILTNLCVNARDAICDVGTITLETGTCSFDASYCRTHPGAEPGAFVRLTVTDNGSGMDAETLTHIFEPFYTTKGVGEGLGLGLAMVHGLVKQHGGFVTVDSRQGEGTTFAIHLPRYLGQAVPPLADVADPAPLRSTETILVVEDEQNLLTLIKKMLEKQGHTVLATNSPDEAIRLAREHAGEIQLLMTDVVMPEMNGYELSKKLIPLSPNLKILYMSGYTSDVIAHHGVLEEGVDFIQKPFPMKTLVAKVRAVLDRK